MQWEDSTVQLGEYRGFALTVCEARRGWWEGWAMFDRPATKASSDRIAIFAEDVNVSRVQAILRGRVDGWHAAARAV